MDLTAKSTRISPLLFLYDTHTDYFRNVIDGISDEDSHKRLDTKANHIAWLAGSLVQQRYDLANLLTGGDHKQKADEYFKEYQGIKDDAQYPSLESYKDDWDIITPILREALVNATDETLDKIFDMEDMKFPYFEMVGFSIHREAYFIGQIGLWRRILGYEPMKYQ